MKYYLLGIKGAGVSALALILNDLGYEVFGYDDTKTFEFTEEKLIERGIKYTTDANNFMDVNTIVVRSSAIKDEHPEIVKARKLNLEIYDLFEYIGKITEQYETISVAGCHGKTTTTAMLNLVMEASIGTSYYIGDGRGKASKSDKVFIAEACEYRRHFMHYKSYYTVITNIDNDHLDYFKDLQDIKNTFAEFTNKTEKLVVAFGDDANIRDLNLKVPVMYYGIKENNDIVARNIETTSSGMKFNVYIEGNFFGSFDLPFYGEHNLQNALAVIAVSSLYGIDAVSINERLKNFKGAARRFSETIIGNSVIVDDYAHHSTEVIATMKSARQKYPDKKIIAIFEPFSYNRVVDLKSDFAKGLNIADKAYVLPINPSRDNPADYLGVTSEMILNLLDNGELITEEDSDKLFKYDNVVFVFMSLKEIHKIKDNLLEHLKKQ